jgi:hypothetical protein
MQLTFEVLHNSVESVKQLLELSPTAKVAYAIAYNARKVNTALEDFNAARAKVIKVYAIEVDGETRIPPESVETFNNEMTELLAQEVEVGIRVISEEQLAECDEKRKDFSVPPGALFNAWFMFEDANS